MNYERWIADRFKMTDEVWLRHANPWSAYTRFAILPLFALAVWSRVWLGYFSLLFVALLIVWNWLNPRVFSKPKLFNHWASKGVFGERIWINRDNIPVPDHHKRLPHILTSIQFAGLAAFLAGLAILDVWITVMGMALVYLKLWYVDRMVWLFEDMKDQYPDFKKRVYPNEP